MNKKKFKKLKKARISEAIFKRFLKSRLKNRRILKKAVRPTLTIPQHTTRAILNDRSVFFKPTSDMITQENDSFISGGEVFFKF